MIIIEPSAQLIHITPNALQLIEQAGRTCYKSEDRITLDSAPRFVQSLINRGHESVLEHATMTVRVICDRGVSHELVRHRIASYSQESTRYCNYSGDKFGSELTFIRPCFDWSELVREAWRAACGDSEYAYFRLLNFGATPQEARSVLPNSLKTEVVMTANFREWRTIFKQRLAKAAHPQMRQVMRMVLELAQENVEVVFDGLNQEC